MTLFNMGMQTIPGGRTAAGTSTATGLCLHAEKHALCVTKTEYQA